AEQDLLLYALDNITSPNFDVKNIFKPKITERINSFLAPFTNQINHEYFKKSYLLGLILTIFSMVLFYLGDKEMSSANYIFILFLSSAFCENIGILYLINSIIQIWIKRRQHNK